MGDMKTRRTAKTHPFLVKEILPPGHVFGLKKKEYIRNERFRTEAEARIEASAILRTGATSVTIWNGKVKLSF